VEAGGTSLVQTLYASLSRAFSKSQEDPKPEETELPNPELLFRRPSLEAELPSKRAAMSRSVRAALEYERNAQALVGKVARSSGRQLKNITLKRSLVKQISQIYEDKTAYGKDHENIKQMSLCAFIYAELLKKYGLQKVAEDKYEQLAASALKHRQHPKIYAFARFLGLLDPFSQAELGYYLAALDTLKACATTQVEDLVYIPLQAAVEVAKTTFGARISPKDLLVFQKELQTLELVTDVPALSGFTSLEAVLRIYMNIYKVENECQRTFVQYIFDAVDLNKDGLLELSEILLLSRHLPGRSLSETQAERIFYEYADLSTEGNEDSLNAISFSNFAEVLFTHQLFSPESFFKFAQVEKLEEIEKRLGTYVTDLKGNVGRMEWRLKQLPKEQGMVLEQYFAAIIEKLKGFRGDPIPLWIAIRVVDEESKEQLASHLTRNLLPSLIPHLPELSSL